MIKAPQSGQAALIMLVILVPVAVLIAFSINILTFANKRSATVFVDSLQSYYAAEAGIEDSLLRLIDPDLEHSPNTSLTVNGAAATTTITEDGSAVTVTSEGNDSNRFRTLSTNLDRNTTGSSFFYGVQVGEQGLFMQNTSKIVGNVYSNGGITGNNSAEITGDAWAAETNPVINMTIGGDVHSFRIEDSDIGGDAYYSDALVDTTVAGTEYPDTPNPSAQPMPISDDQITTWKNAAAAGALLSDTVLDGGSHIFGPTKINGNLIVNNDARLTIAGTIWVTGNVTLQNNGVLELDDAYGSNSGTIVSDGVISVQNSFRICGSEGYNTSTNDCNPANDTYVLLLSTSTADPAIKMQNGTDLHGILYTSAGVLEIENSGSLKEAVGYGLRIQNSAEVIYETGLASVEFSSGPAGGFTITAWQEIE